MTSVLALWLSLSPAVTQWDAPPACPGRAEVDAQVEMLLLEPQATPPSYRGRIESTGEGYRLELDVGAVHRTVDAADCARLGTAAALIVAVEHDPVAVAGAVEPIVQRPRHVSEEPPKVPEATPPPATDDVPPAPSRPARSAEPAVVAPTPIGGGVRLGVGPEAGLLPEVRAAFDIAGALQRQVWRFELGATVSLPRESTFASSSQVGVRTMLFSGRARGCWAPGMGRLEIPLCVGAAVGGLWASGFGPGVAADPRTQTWASALASAGIEVSIARRFGLFAMAEIDVALRRPAVHVEGLEPNPEQLRLGSAGARLLLGPTLRFR